MDDQDTNKTALVGSDNSIECKFEEVFNLQKNKVISADGLTLAEVFQALVRMLDSDLELAKKVLAYANIMVKHGMKVAKESQLNRADVLRALEGKENIVSRQNIKKLLPTPAVKSIKKRIRGF